MWFGGTFIHHFFPRRKVFIDGRTVYERKFFLGDYARIKMARPGWEDVIEKWNIKWFLLTENRFARLHWALNNHPDWELTRLDGNCVIFEKATDAAVEE